jgi:UDP-3-O-[3-hydroxymyristoyl] glucosamine N-acyltransferase
MKKKLNNLRIVYFIGSGDLGQYISFLAKRENLINETKFVDDKSKLTIKNLLKTKKLIYCIITIGNQKNRYHVYEKLFKRKNIRFINLILTDEKKILTNKIKIGSILEDGVSLNLDSSIGKHTICFSNATIGHGVKIGNFCNVGNNVVIAGNTKIANFVEIGANSFIAKNLVIVSNVIIFPGSNIFKNINKPGVYKDNTFIQKI